MVDAARKQLMALLRLGSRVKHEGCESRSFGKSELQLGRPPESEPNRPEKGPEWG